MAQPAANKPLIIQCPRCRWRAPAPPGWKAPFAVCPQCDARVPNPDPRVHLESRDRSEPRSRRAPQRMPAGYRLEVDSLSRRVFDHWVRNIFIVLVAVGAVLATFKVILKQRQSSPGYVEPLDFAELSQDGTLSLPPGLSGVEGAAGTEAEEFSGVSALTTVEWDSDAVFRFDGEGRGEEGIWDAVKAPKETPPPAASSFSDPALPSLDSFE